MQNHVVWMQFIEQVKEGREYSNCLRAEAVQSMAERVRFELTKPFGSPVFKTGAINRSATSPSLTILAENLFLVISTLSRMLRKRGIAMLHKRNIALLIFEDNSQLGLGMSPGALSPVQSTPAGPRCLTSRSCHWRRR
jgi:hypothetical protein